MGDWMREGGAEERKAGWILIDSRSACYVALRTLGAPDQDDPRFEKRAMGNCNLCFGGAEADWGCRQFGRHWLICPALPTAISLLKPELQSWRHLIGLSIGRSRLPAPWAASKKMQPLRHSSASIFGIRVKML